ncbi:hypothetical protein SU69_07575 [Thermosipho melanesiensis]|nr:hypothetical protein SU68_07645 [Thermosipho melanesiensis]OOC37177.1 hypothetical protein SU69_07575 [Thermosipho melanesiensis]OOC37929.1 hypothetical protein SU70_07585 [Thermosipho melanesiensis]OOC41157.1 hypothetical protein SU71_07570 [Thermosipho melanesiensis]OOC43152.1 hypothetical protein SU72_07575 [Thermosipho melanesiensis]
MWKGLIITGIILVVMGILWMIMEKIKIFPLPGDIFIKKENLVIYIPITTMILISLVLTLLINLIFKR